MTVRDELIAACDAGDQLAIRRLGWYEIHEACDTWWAPRQGCTPEQLTPYAKVVGDADPELVLEASENWLVNGGQCPAPSAATSTASATSPRQQSTPAAAATSPRHPRH
jgi:hypothetical protein